MDHYFETETTYQQGWDQWHRKEPIGGSVDGLAFVLPLAIADRRSPGAPTDQLPSWDELSDEEAFAAKVLYEVLHRVGHPVSAYPRFLGELSILEIELPRLAEANLAWRRRRHALDKESNGALQAVLKYTASIVATVKAEGLPDETSPVEFVSMDNLEWLEANRDPDLWHRLIFEANWDLECTEVFASWLIEQPDCDRATAAALFIAGNGVDVVFGRPRAQRAEAGIDYVPFGERLVELIVHRSEYGDGFPRSELTLSELGFADDQLTVLRTFSDARPDQIEQPIPRRLLGDVFSGRRSSTPYVLVDESLIARGY